jgi:hypothetical protein
LIFTPSWLLVFTSSWLLEMCYLCCLLCHNKVVSYD